MATRYRGLRPINPRLICSSFTFRRILIFPRFNKLFIDLMKAPARPASVGEIAKVLNTNKKPYTVFFKLSSDHATTEFIGRPGDQWKDVNSWLHLSQLPLLLWRTKPLLRQVQPGLGNIMRSAEYHLQTGPQIKVTESYISDALIPALNRLGIAPVGAFHLDIGPETPTLYLLVTMHQT